MSITVIQVGPNGAGAMVSVNLVQAPLSGPQLPAAEQPAAPAQPMPVSALAFRSVQLVANDTVATVRSPFTGIVQRQIWPGADYWSGTLALPTLNYRNLGVWTAFLLELRGRANAFQLGDPLCLSPRGRPQGAPVCNTSGGTGYNAVATTTLYTRGWTANAFRVLLPGDNLQVGYRLHKVLDVVNVDENGDAAINVWPSLREVPADGQAIIFRNPAGLFALASNQRQWSMDVETLSQMSFEIEEYR